MSSNPPEDLRKAIAEGRCLIVCGAGVSRLATANEAPGWGELIKLGLALAKPEGGREPAWVRACQELLQSDAAADDWLEAADTIQDKLGGCEGQEYLAFLRQSVGELTPEKPEVLAALRRLLEAGNRLATTNYDNLLCGATGCVPETWEAPQNVADALEGKHKAVVHLHGHWRAASSVVFSKKDYARVRGQESTQFLQKLATHNFTLVFVGCSASGLGDENVGELLAWFGKNWLGRGKRHYVLVRDGDAKAAWPKSIEPVTYGNDFDELPGLLDALLPAPPASAKVAPSASRALLPPNPNMIGRGPQLAELVAHILGGNRPIIIPGGPGMGKTTLALAAAYDSRVRDRFGQARVFVDLQAVTSADALLRLSASAIGVETTGSTADVLAGLTAYASKAPTLAILDNLETPWHAEAIATEEMLGQLAGIGGLRLVLTVRGETPRVAGGAHRLGDIERLPADQARELLLREAGESFADDPALPGLLEALDGHPLSIMLMAAQADGRRELARLLQDWNTRRASVLARGPASNRMTSVRVSLGLSLAQLSEAPKRLLGLVAMLPAGLQENDVAALLPDMGAAEAVAALVKSRLVESRGGRLTMLAPLRETAREEKLATPEDEARLVAHFLAIAADGVKIGWDAWQSVRERVTFEAGNLDANASSRSNRCQRTRKA